MKKTAEEILISEYLEEVKDIPVSGLPLFSANDCRILMSRFAEFSSQDKWVSVETPPKEHGKLYLCYQPIDAEDFKFIILWFDKMTSKFRGWSDEFENRDEDGDFRSVTHWQELPALPSPPKTK